MASVQDYYGCKCPARPAGRKTPTAILIGVEVELEGVMIKQQRVGKPPLNWNVIEDNSLKDAGREFTSPMWSTHFEEQIKNLFDNLDRYKISPRCSVHVHTDVTKYTKEQLKSLIVLYTIFERALFNFSGKRWNSNYCVPVQTWAVGIKIREMDFNDLTRSFPKYSALNILPDNGKLGTVEYRHMIGTDNILLLKEWVNILVNLTKAAATYPFEQLLEDIKDMRNNSHYWELFQNVFKESAASLNYPSINKDIEFGITFAKLISTK